MLIVDTNIISEFMKPIGQQNKKAVDCFARFDPTRVWTTSICVVESFYGIELLDDGRRKEDNRRTLESVYRRLFGDRILPFDTSAARTYVVLLMERKKAGRPIRQFDAQIASIARSKNATIVTRDSDYLHCGIDVINPWE